MRESFPARIPRESLTPSLHNLGEAHGHIATGCANGLLIFRNVALLPGRGVSYHRLAMTRQAAHRAASAPTQSARKLPLANHATGEQLRTTHTPELVIALCGPIGSPLHDVASTLQALLKDEYDYACHVIRPSRFISDRFPIPVGATLNARAHHLIQKGDDTSADDNDCRCCNYRDTICHNDAHKQQISQEVAQALVKEKLIKQADVQAATEVVRKSRVGSLVEFSRAVHAEMHAIVLGSQIGGARMKGASLYCTTYPCHSCARHIVLAGISTVYYIEPYPKSQAIALHEDAISETDGAPSKVQFLPHEGVGPSRYLEVFGVGSGKRKSDGDGKMIRQQKSSALPKDNRSLESFPTLEGLVVAHLHKTGVLSQNAASHEDPA